jgi:hypothetical protein
MRSYTPLRLNVNLFNLKKAKPNDKLTSKSFIEYKKEEINDIIKTPIRKPSSQYREKSIDRINKSAIYHNNEIESKVDMGYCRDLHEKLLKEQQDKIKAQIKQRENLSQIASQQALKLKNYNKDDLIRQNESDIFFLHRTRKDPILEKARQRSQIIENKMPVLAKHIKNEKPEVTSYYNKCVE